MFTSTPQAHARTQTYIPTYGEQAAVLLSDFGLSALSVTQGPVSSSPLLFFYWSPCSRPARSSLYQWCCAALLLSTPSPDCFALASSAPISASSPPSFHLATIFLSVTHSACLCLRPEMAMHLYYTVCSCLNYWFIIDSIFSLISLSLALSSVITLLAFSVSSTASSLSLSSKEIDTLKLRTTVPVPFYLLSSPLTSHTSPPAFSYYFFPLVLSHRCEEPQHTHISLLPLPGLQSELIKSRLVQL